MFPTTEVTDTGRPVSTEETPSRQRFIIKDDNWERHAGVTCRPTDVCLGEPSSHLSGVDLLFKHLYKRTPDPTPRVFLPLFMDESRPLLRTSSTVPYTQTRPVTRPVPFLPPQSSVLGPGRFGKKYTGVCSVKRKDMGKGVGILHVGGSTNLLPEVVFAASKYLRLHGPPILLKIRSQDDRH